MAYDFSRPETRSADRICYTAGHKALGLYALWALRNELVRIADPGLLAPVERQLRLEDLLGFRKNPVESAPLFRKFGCKALDGHPTPAMPFVPLATGASGVGLAAAVGQALASADVYGTEGPRFHLIEGEGGLTPGRVQEAMAAASIAGLANVILHVDWNQSSIDSDKVCAENGLPGDYVPWNPLELARFHDWNIVEAGDGHDIGRVLAAQSMALALRNGRPSAVVYRTTKGWRYGLEGRASHGAGHAFCSRKYHEALRPFEARFGAKFPIFEGEPSVERVEEAFWATLSSVRTALEASPSLADAGAKMILAARERLLGARRKIRDRAPRIEVLYAGGLDWGAVPVDLRLEPGRPATLRGALGATLGYLNRLTGGAVLGCAADLLESTSVAGLNAGFPKGFFHAESNPGSRQVAVGGICEDAMGAAMAGVSSFGSHLGVTSSYAAFIAPLEHIAARLHGIGEQARRTWNREPFRTWIMVNAHAGPQTGEDGSTHADPQALQLLQQNFPDGILITLTPWDPQEVWPLMAAGLSARPAVLAPFLTRPAQPVPDRRALGLPPAEAAVQGVYSLRRADVAATVVLQGCGAASIFMREVLPRLDLEKVPVNVYYVASAELFDRLPAEAQRAIFPEEHARLAFGITDFTLPTLHRWICSERGRRHSLHPFRKGAFLGSGSWDKVLAEAGLDGPSQFKAVLDWARLAVRPG